jgi:hypothetical protein
MEVGYIRSPLLLVPPLRRYIVTLLLSVSTLSALGVPANLDSCRRRLLAIGLPW